MTTTKTPSDGSLVCAVAWTILSLAFAIVLACLFLPPASAADKGAARAAVAVADERPFWTGCFVEAGVGDRSSTGMVDGIAVVGGAGCNWRAGASPLVLGGLARYGVTVLHADSAGATLAFDHPGAFLARAGYLVTPATLLYATGGLTFARYEEPGRVRWRSGQALGLGLETRLSNTISIGVEYLWEDHGRVEAYGMTAVLRHRF